MTKRRVPLSARERNGMIALLTIGLILIGGGFFVRQFNRSDSLPPGVIITSDTDSVDIYDDYREEAASYARKSKKRHRSSTDSVSAQRPKAKKASKKRKTSKSQQPTLPVRKHLDEDLND